MMEDPDDHKKSSFRLRSVKQWARSLKAGRPTSQNPTDHAETLSRSPSSVQSPKPGRGHDQANNGNGPIVGTETLSELPSRIHNQGEVPPSRDGSSSTAGAVVRASGSDNSAVPRPVAPDDAGAEKQISGSLVIELWNDAFQVVKNDENMGQLLQDYETQLKKTLTQGNSPLSSNFMKEWLVMVGKAQDESKKHKTAKDTTLGVLGVVKGPSSFIATMLSQSPPAAMVWAGVCAAIPLLRGTNRDADLSRTGQSIRATVQSLYQHTLEFVILSVCSIHRRRFRRVWQALPGQTEWETRLENIEKTEQALSRDTSIFQMSDLLFRIDDFMDFYRQTQYREEAKAKKEKRSRLFNNLKGTDYKERLLATRKRVDGTC
ncbi:ankyrin repeat protein [Colletotrichum sojae]|uniref:Ankyrin repeat protein n=1 Tax=Colletotrichum sojae TaxID=2175907 RepID=A0A8H6J2L1_9PEZI|nr:ankyrin repeat protein [Colletotrichum sojae]